MGRALICFLTYRIKDPTSGAAFLFYVPLMHVSFYATIISLTSYMQKLYPKEIRGMCNSVSAVFGTIGSYFYIAYSQSLYKQHPKLVFLGVTVSDFIVIIACSAFAFMGYLKEPKDIHI